jgi:hypothetical protein
MTGFTELIRAIAALLWPIFAFCALYMYRRELRELLTRVRKGKLLGSEFEFDAHAAALNAERKADAALASLSDASPRGANSSTKASMESAIADLHALATQYDRLRSGPNPASGAGPAVSEIVGRMIRAADAAAEFNLEAALASRSQGERMSGYAYVYAKPAAEHLPLLVNAIAEGEPSGNGQYWAIQALAKVYAIASEAQRHAADVTLRRVLARYGPGSDRGYALRKVLGPPASS